MSQAAHVLRNRSDLAKNWSNWEIIDSMVTDGLWDAFNDLSHGPNAENIGFSLDISRQEQRYLCGNLQQKATQAQASGSFC